MKRISTIIPNFNTAQWLSQALDSVLSQHGDFELEIIIVDDHSTDNSWEILKEYQEKFPEQIHIYRNEGKGGNFARNFGFTKSTGDFIQWLDSDDVLLPNKFAEQMEFFLLNEEVEITYSDWRMDLYENGQKIDEVIRREKPETFFLQKLILDEWKPNNSYLLRRSMAEKLHRLTAWNPERKVAQDREYFTLAAIHTAKFAYVPGLFSVYNRWSSKSVSAMNFKRRLRLSLELEEFFMEEIVAQEWIPPAEKKKLVALLKTDSLKACFYDPRLKIRKPVSFNEIKWKRIHYKMRPFIPFIFLWQNFKLKLQK